MQPTTEPQIITYWPTIAPKKKEMAFKILAFLLVLLLWNVLANPFLKTNQQKWINISFFTIIGLVACVVLAFVKKIEKIELDKINKKITVYYGFLLLADKVQIISLDNKEPGFFQQHAGRARDFLFTLKHNEQHVFKVKTDPSDFDEETLFHLFEQIETLNYKPKKLVQPIIAGEETNNETKSTV
jgi:hypothetical protein